jgi:hypothetical protein
MKEGEREKYDKTKVKRQKIKVGPKPEEYR